MDLNNLRTNVRQQLTQERYEHTIRVEETAVLLAKRFPVSEEKVRIAAILHDYAKCKPQDVLKNAILQYELPTTLIEYHHELWHGPVASEIAKRKFNIADMDILNAIYYHTTGRANMSRLELIIFVADYIEPGRSFPGVEEVRALANENLYKAAQKAVANTIGYLMHLTATIHPDTFLAYNDLIKKLGVSDD